MTKTYPAIDYVKLLMAVFVVGIHRPLFQGDWADYMTGSVLFSVAVPFFFVTSSFLFFRKLQRPQTDRKDALLQYEKRLMLLYLIYTVIYLPCIFVNLHTEHYDEITVRALAGDMVFILKETVLNVSFVHLWYLNTLIASIFVLYWLTQKVQNKWAVLGFGVLCFVGIKTLQIVWPGASELPRLVMNTLKTGLPCTCAGYFAAQNGDDCSRAEQWAFPVSGAVLLLLGAWTFSNRSDGILAVKAVFSYMTAYYLMRLCVSSDLQPNPISKTIRTYSTLIYFWHLLLMSEGFRFLSVHFDLPGLQNCNFLRFSVTLCLAVLEATAIILLQKKKAFHWLRYLY